MSDKQLVIIMSNYVNRQFTKIMHEYRKMYKKIHINNHRYVDFSSFKARLKFFEHSLNPDFGSVFPQLESQWACVVLSQ